MPFFSRREPEEEVPVQQPVEPEPVPKRHHGLFGSRRDHSPNGSAYTDNSYGTANNGPSRAGTTATRVSDGSAGSGSGTGRRSFLRRSHNGGSNHLSSNPEMDPSIVQARERVMSAEAAERAADRALEIARREVHEAREHVRRLEIEAKEEARRARIKQYHANEVSKRAKPLGRHELH